MCYKMLIAKGIAIDPNLDDVYAALEAYRQNETMQWLLKRLIGLLPLLKYILHTGKGPRMQIRARIFALRWLRGDLRGAAALINRVVD